MMKLCLVVASSRENRASVCRILEKMQFSCADEGGETVAYIDLRDQKPDIIVLDCDNPEQDGPAFRKKIDDLKRAGYHAVLMCVDELSHACARQALAAGGDYKPGQAFDPCAVMEKFAQMGFIRRTDSAPTSYTMQ